MPLCCPDDVGAHVGETSFVLSRKGQEVVGVDALLEAFFHREIVDNDAGTASLVADAPAALVEQGTAVFDKELNDADGFRAGSNSDKGLAARAC